MAGCSCRKPVCVCKTVIIRTSNIQGSGTGTGPVGPQGPQGVPGPAGPSGAGAVTATNNNDGTYTFFQDGVEIITINTNYFP